MIFCIFYISNLHHEMLITQFFLFFKIGFKPLAETFLKRFFGVFFVNIPGLKTSLPYICIIYVFFDSIQRSENDSFLTAKFCTPFRLQKSFFYIFFSSKICIYISLFKTKKNQKTDINPSWNFFESVFLKLF